MLLGFGYEFDALDETKKTDELADAFALVFKTGQQLKSHLRSWVPLLQWIVRARSRVPRGPSDLHSA